MQLSELLTGAGLAASGLAFALLILFAAYWLKQKIGNERLALIGSYSLQSVLAVEQMWRSGQIQSDGRYDAVCDYLIKKFPGLTEVEIENFVESALAEVKIQLGEWTKPIPQDAQLLDN